MEKSLYLLRHDISSHAKVVEREISEIKRHFNGGTDRTEDDDVHSSRTVWIGDGLPKQANEECFPSLRSYFLNLFRCFSLHKNERELVLSAEDQLVALQLCLADLNKKKFGEFDVEVSKVVEWNRKIVQNVLGATDTASLCVTSDNISLTSDPLNDSGKQEEPSELFQAYEQFLHDNNVTDFAHLFLRVKQEAVCNEALSASLQESNFVLVNLEDNEIDRAMCSLLSSDKQGYSVEVAQPLDQSAIVLEDPDVDSVQWEVMIEPCACPQDVVMDSPPPASGFSVTEMYIEQLMCGYLQLLVNSRSELSLARIINVPERGLNHRAFTAVKHEAQQKGLSMYQVANSFVMRLRLGRSNNPEHRLAHHVKGLGEFVDLMHKLMNVVEEDLNVKSAIRRILTTLKNLALKCSDTHLRRGSMEAVKDKLLAEMEELVDKRMHVQTHTPTKDVSSGSSQQGRHSLRVMRAMIDARCAVTCPASTVQVLSDSISSQKTPVRFASVLSKFKSPTEHSPGSQQDKSLAQRMKEKMPHKVVKRGQPPPAWNMFEQYEEEKALPETLDDYIPSRTVVHPGVGHNQRMIRLGSAKDQENLGQTRLCEAVALSSHSEPKPRGMVDTTNTSRGPSTIGKTKSGVKRASSDLDTACGDVVSQPAKKTKISSAAATGKPSKPSKPKTSKKKAAPLLKGQKTMTAFFRI